MKDDGAEYRYTRELSPALDEREAFECGGYLWMEWIDPDSGSLLDAPNICLALAPPGAAEDVLRWSARDVLLHGALDPVRMRENWTGTLTFTSRADFERYNAAHEYMARWFERLAEQIRSRKLTEEDLTDNVWEK